MWSDKPTVEELCVKLDSRLFLWTKHPAKMEYRTYSKNAVIKKTNGGHSGFQQLPPNWHGSIQLGGH